MIGGNRKLRLAAWLGALLLCPWPAYGQAKAVIQLPIAKVISVQTTVTVPDSGGGVLGGLSSGYNSRNGMARGDAKDGMGANVHAVIIDFDSMEEMTNWTIAKSNWDSGKVADAVIRFQEMAEKGGTKDLKSAASEVLDFIRQEGLVKYQAAVRLANTDPIQGADKLDVVMEQYGGLIQNTKRRADQLALQRSPLVAEAGNGKTAAEYVEKAKLAEEKGKLGVATIYYRMASKLVGTSAAKEATVELARIEKAKAVIAKVSPKQPTRPGVQVPEAPLSEKAVSLIDLARQYRKADPEKARGFYQQALQEIPAETEHYLRVSAEFRSLDASGQKSPATKRRK